MPILSAGDSAKVKSYFQENLKKPVTIELFTEPRSLLVVPGRQECEYCAETEELLDEVAGLSDQVSLIVNDLRANPEAGGRDGILPAMVPAFVLRGENRGSLRYFGIPAGYEFSNLIQGIVDVSTGTTPLSQTTKDELANLTGDVHIRVFVTPT